MGSHKSKIFFWGGGDHPALRYLYRKILNPSLIFATDENLSSTFCNLESLVKVVFFMKNRLCHNFFMKSFFFS
jgi:hypothetical protein